MKYWYYTDGENKLGPFTIEELKSKRIRKSALVWTEGMTEWNRADSVEELTSISIAEPPPLPTKVEVTTKRVQRNSILIMKKNSTLL